MYGTDLPEVLSRSALLVNGPAEKTVNGRINRAIWKNQWKSQWKKQSYLKNVQNILEQAKSAELQDYFQNDCVIPDESVNLDQIEAATAVI